MRQRVLMPVIIASLALVVASCASLERDEVAAPATGGAVAMRAGTALVVNLPLDASGGSTWEVRAASPNLARIGGPDITPAPKPIGLVGVADTVTFRFRATAQGAGTLEFARRSSSGSPSSAPEPVVRYDVAVGPPMRLASDFFGTMGMQSARPAGNSTMGVPPTAATGAPPASGAITPATPAPSAGAGSGGAPSAVKYWAF